MGTTKKRIIMNTFFKSQFNYCPLVWICCNRSLNTKINRLHELCLRMVYNNNKSNFNELLVKNGSVSIHHQNLQKLSVEMFKVSRGLSRKIVKRFTSCKKMFGIDKMLVLLLRINSPLIFTIYNI